MRPTYARHSELHGPIEFEDGKSSHFTYDEARCRCGCQSLPEDPQVIVNTARFLEEVRKILGGPMFISSWVRCVANNRRVGGASDSQHLYGYAIDFHCKHLTPRQVATRLKPYLGKLIGGLGSYPSWVHVDRRTNGPAYWRE
jgi:hypothetical protein